MKYDFKDKYVEGKDWLSTEAFKDRYVVITDNIEIDIDLSNLRNKLGQAQTDLAYQIMADTDNYVPFQRGDLSQSAHTENNDTEIVYDMPYARFLYMGRELLDVRGSAWARKGQRKPCVSGDLTYSKEHHSKAGAKWFERSKEDNLNNWIEVVKKAVK